MTLTEEMQAVLFEMKWLLPWGKVTSYSPTGGGGVPDSRPPAAVRVKGDPEPHVFWAEKWDRAVSTYRKEKVLEAAREELETWRKRPKVDVAGETLEELEARIIEKGRGWSIAEVTQSSEFNVTPTFVRRARSKAGVSVTTGKLPASLMVKPPRDQRAEKAREMRREGMSMRQIGMLLECDPMTVHRDLAA